MVMRKYKWLQISILLAIVIVGGYTIADSLFADNDPVPAVGDRAPGFSLKGLDGEVYRLSDFAGKPVVLNFWGTFCEPCVREMPLIQQHYEKYQDRGLVVLGVNLDEPEVTVRGFVKDYGLTFPILLDKNVVRKQYGVYYYPTTFFIDAEGRIVDKFVGEMKRQDLETRILQMFANRQDA
jgi:peroxiredoxin